MTDSQLTPAASAASPTRASSGPMPARPSRIPKSMTCMPSFNKTPRDPAVATVTLPPYDLEFAPGQVAADVLPAGQARDNLVTWIVTTGVYVATLGLI